MIGALPAGQQGRAPARPRVRLDDPAQALRHGIGLLPESRKSEGLIIDFGIRENISLNNLAKYTGRGLIGRKARLATTPS